jgi:hypothetical protein
MEILAALFYLRVDADFPKGMAVAKPACIQNEFEVNKNRKGRALPQAQPFLHSFRGCVIWAETFSLFTCVLTPQATPVLVDILLKIRNSSIQQSYEALISAVKFF